MKEAQEANVESDREFELRMRLSSMEAESEFHRRGLIIAKIVGLIGWVLFFAHAVWVAQQ